MRGALFFWVFHLLLAQTVVKYGFFRMAIRGRLLWRTRPGLPVSVTSVDIFLRSLWAQSLVLAHTE